MKLLGFFEVFFKYIVVRKVLDGIWYGYWIIFLIVKYYYNFKVGSMFILE